jgi:hypothetical protein
MKTTTKKISLFTLAALALAALLAPAARAENPGAHPAYMHALQDLRDARAHLERRPGDMKVKWDESVAIREVDAAIFEIKKASIDDGKNMANHPPIDAQLDYHGRLHHALELLRKAHSDVKQEEDNAFAQGLQHRSLQHIDAAINFTEEALANGDRHHWW